MSAVAEPSVSSVKRAAEMSLRRSVRVALLSLLLTGVCDSVGESAEGDPPLPASVSRVAIGVRLDDRPVVALTPHHFQEPASPRSHVLLVVDENRDGVAFADLIAAGWSRFLSETNSDLCPDIALVRIAKDSAPAKFPPDGASYQGPDPAAQYLWRWMGMAAPDLVIEIRASSSDHWLAPAAAVARLGDLRSQLGIETLSDKQLDDGTLIASLATNFPCDVGNVLAIQLETNDVNSALKRLADVTAKSSLPKSPARLELLRRGGRSPIEIAAELSKVYGHQLSSVAYIPSLALIGRLRLGELTDENSHLQDVLKIVAPYVDGTRSSLGEKPSGSTMPGHLVFGELADRTKHSRFVELACVAGNLGFNEDGSLKPSMPYHSEMSDAVFMGTPILVQCGRLTGETKYFDMAARHLRFMLKLNLRDDGLHQHSPIDPEHTAWGRGNGFPGLGLALCLSDLPDDSQYRNEFLSAYRAHMAAMIRHQDGTGMWHQIVDHPESYREFTVTCMTTFAITRGLRRGWLDRETYEPVVRRAWEAIKLRIGPDGKLVDVCTGTGKMKSRREYYHRAAILGRDDRGGAIALMVSTELAFAQREGAVDLK
ncbi:hypothetical protein GC176_18670 [bacterium]|nr:hypothetical protein [bacterium]